MTNNNYKIEESTGILKQIKIVNPIQYNPEYVNERYNSYGELGKRMSFLRLGFIIGAIGDNIKSLCDVGYGNGDFLYTCQEYGISKLTGVDVSGYKLTDDIEQLKEIPTDKQFDVVCFFDSLEHFHSLDFLANIKTKHFYISFPECHYCNDNDRDKFIDWKHRREDEHIYHFSKKTIMELFNKLGYKLIAFSCLEDTIRKSTYKDNELWNISSVIFASTETEKTTTSINTDFEKL